MPEIVHETIRNSGKVKFILTTVHTTGMDESEVIRRRWEKSVFQSFQLSVKSAIRTVTRTVQITDQSHPTPFPTLRSAVPVTSLLSDSLHLISSSSFTWSCSSFYSPFPSSPQFPPWRSHPLALCQAFTPEITSSFTHPCRHPPTNTHTHTHSPLTFPRAPVAILSFKLASRISALLNHPCCTTTCINTDCALTLTISSLLHPPSSQ